MASSDSKSISGSQSIPFSRHTTDIFQDMTAFSPPPTSSTTEWIVKQEQRKNLNRVPAVVPRAHQLEESCKNYIESAEISVKSNKALGTDDHFKSMVCSKNLLKVCEKLMTNRDSTKINAVVVDDDDDDDFDTELSLMNEKSRMEYYRNKHGNRRNSQSLPASPKMERKNTAVTPAGYNPYFTISQTSEGRPESSITFLTNLFGISARKPSSEIQSSSSQKLNTIDRETQSNVATAGDELKQENRPKMVPQPHEYRELNFWSPTSM